VAEQLAGKYGSPFCRMAGVQPFDGSAMGSAEPGATAAMQAVTKSRPVKRMGGYYADPAGHPSNTNRPSRLITSPSTSIVPPCLRSHTMSQCRPEPFVLPVSG